MGATLTNLRTGQQVQAVSDPNTAVSNPLQVMVGDTVRLSWTVTNIGSSTGNFRIVWTTGVGDLVSNTFTLSAGQNASGTLDVKYNNVMNAFPSSIRVENITLNKIDHILYAGIQVQEAPKGRIDHPELPFGLPPELVVIGGIALVGVGAFVLADILRKQRI